MDTMQGVDELPERDIVDINTISYCDLFLDFIISAEICILNGRKCTRNDFTRVGSTGSSVVDYCLVPCDNLINFKNFMVTRAATLFLGL